MSSNRDQLTSTGINLPHSKKAAQTKQTHLKARIEGVCHATPTHWSFVLVQLFFCIVPTVETPINSVRLKGVCFFFWVLRVKCTACSCCIHWQEERKLQETTSNPFAVPARLNNSCKARTLHSPGTPKGLPGVRQSSAFGSLDPRASR